MKKGSLVVYNASEVVTCAGFKGKSGSQMNDLNVIKKASIIVEDGVITKITTDSLDLKQFESKGYTLVDATDKCVLPGLVDSHTHFIFGGYREEEYNWRLSGMPYMEI